jgi:uncharacterized OB-fold protein
MEKIEEILYIDPQQQQPGGKCRLCDAIVYPPGYHCPRCERRSYGVSRPKQRL